jgi:aspartyl-tRNA(Asn)/glutamyl-tRNA(Gln) amidotransferase subunit A
MPDSSMADAVFWPVRELVSAYRTRSLSPLELTRQIFDRIERVDGELHSYISTSKTLALAQAKAAERLYVSEDSPLAPLLGVPMSIKDLFDVSGMPTTLGSAVYGSKAAASDSEPVGRLRHAGAVFLGKSNTAEFGQSATTDNLLGPACANPWDPARTAGGSSGGAAASVGAGLATAALASDGGGSIRVPAAMCGLFGLKPTLGLVPDSGPFRAMTAFVCPGPIARRVADARALLEVCAGGKFARTEVTRSRIGWCPAPERHPVDPGVADVVARAVAQLEAMGHEVEEIALPVDGWLDAFGPLVLADEQRYRRHLLDDRAEQLTEYARKSIEAAISVTPDDVAAAATVKQEIQQRVTRLFELYDFVVTPTTAAVAFPLGQRPREIDGQPVDGLWGAFPFTAPFNVSGSPAASVPCGLVDGMPVGLQVVGPAHAELAILDLSESIEEAVGFPAYEMQRRWGNGHATPSPGIALERHGRVVVIRLDRPERRNAISRAGLTAVPRLLSDAARSGAGAVVVTGAQDCFSAGVDLAEVQGTPSDLELDTLIGAAVNAIRELPIPVLAAVEGPCIGAAVELVVACDLRVAGVGSYFQLPAAKLGLLYRLEGTSRLAAELGRQVVARMLVCGDRIPAEEALPAGIVTKVSPAGAALDAALALATTAAQGEPEATGLNKRLIAELTSSAPASADWEAVRLKQLGSEARRNAVASVKQRVEP